MSTLRTLETRSVATSQRRREFHYRWEWPLKSSPEALWPLVADTERFNRDTGVPAVRILRDEPMFNGRRMLKMHRFNVLGLKLVPIVWYEDPFEWMHPYRFGVVRNYVTGPVRQMRVRADLNPRADGGTDAVYQVWISPANPLGYAAIPFQVGILSARRFRQAFHHYDAVVQRGEHLALELHRPGLSPGGAERLKRGRANLIAQGGDGAIIDRLIALIERGDDLTLQRLRPYALADAWGLPRRQVLELCLMATRAGLLDFRWELLCPGCRGAKAVDDHLSEIETSVHCEVCHIDFDVNFEQSVELTFRPNTAIRTIDEAQFCVGGPQVTPHIVAQALLQGHDEAVLDLTLEPGRYRARALNGQGAELIRVEHGGPQAIHIAVGGRAHEHERIVGTTPAMTLENRSADEQLILLERMAWSDQAATAAEVTALQMFRDLFASEALKADVQMSVGAMTVMFTDLRGSTQLYRTIGDAPAFGVVIDHFEVLRGAVAAHNGAIVKTIGDAVMAVFRRPVHALQAALAAQEALNHPADGKPALSLKVGIHSGSAIAVTLNERLDYFGTTVNLAARLAELSSGSDVIVSDDVYSDPEVMQLLALHDFTRYSDAFITRLRGFDDLVLRLHRVGLRQLLSSELQGLPS